MTHLEVHFAAASNAGWSRLASCFAAPSGPYDPLQWRLVVLQHRLIQQLVAILRLCIPDPESDDEPVLLDEQGLWLPLQPVLWAFDILIPPEALFPLPQPRPGGRDAPNPRLIALDEQLLYACQTPAYVPAGLILTRLAPGSKWQPAQVVTGWLLHQVLPLCTQCGGPDSWEGLDAMLSPVP